MWDSVTIQNVAHPYHDSTSVALMSFTNVCRLIVRVLHPPYCNTSGITLQIKLGFIGKEIMTIPACGTQSRLSLYQKASRYLS
ncbi:hypothetical protein CEXT_413821 [Caerostris extrusa]|uniref:Uncharacterized protein n=1 Tax=Caerostris extrusa TaxID=172846 RepID=A0AAV4NCX3_CAEEX|nr:hypothetical protein CEXT_413821 [Caerostris extrusa]